MVYNSFDLLGQCNSSSLHWDATSQTLCGWGSQETLMLVIILLLHEESSMSVGNSAIDAEVTIHPLVCMCV